MICLYYILLIHLLKSHISIYEIQNISIAIVKTWKETILAKTILWRIAAAHIGGGSQTRWNINNMITCSHWTSFAHEPIMMLKKLGE